MLKNLWGRKELLLFGAIIAFFAVICYISISTFNVLQNITKVTNYTGIVRGGTQKLIKEELMGWYYSRNDSSFTGNTDWYPDDGLVLKLDSIVEELLTGRGPNGLAVLQNEDFLGKMRQVEAEWTTLKEEIIRVRAGAAPDRLFEMSQSYFNLCNDTVFAAEAYSSVQVSHMTFILVFTNSFFLVSVLILLFVMFSNRRRESKRLETQARDRTDEKLETLAKLDTVISNYKGLIWSSDNNDVVTTFNGQLLETFGIDSKMVVGKDQSIISQISSLPDITEKVKQTFREGSLVWVEEYNDRIYKYSAKLIYDKDGKVLGIVGSTDDETESYQLRRDLEEAVKAAEAANNAKSSFLATMSHEIRTPMNAILGITEILLQDGELSKDTQEALGKIHNSGSLLLGIINDILDLSKIEAGKFELEPAQYDVASLISDTVNLNMMRFENKPVEFELKVNENIPSELFGDALRIKQILNNLLSNAAKYTDRGHVVLSVTDEITEGSEHPDVKMMFCVEDTGRGMSQEQIQKLFDEYTRFDTKANRTTEGTGLGMSITKNLIRIMSGEITVESRRGEGTVFNVWLPQSDVGASALGRDVVDNLENFRFGHSPQVRNMPVTREPMPYGSVLVVDDVATNIYVAKGLMLPYQLKIDSALSGFEAVDKISGGREYDIIFMDHMMPNMDGIEAARRIRELGYTKPIVALTADAVVGQAEIFLSKGFDAFISKPIDIRQLNTTLNKLVRDRHTPESS